MNAASSDLRHCSSLSGPGTMQSSCQPNGQEVIPPWCMPKDSTTEMVANGLGTDANRLPHHAHAPIERQAHNLPNSEVDSDHEWEALAVSVRIPHQMRGGDRAPSIQHPNAQGSSSVLENFAYKSPRSLVADESCQPVATTWLRNGGAYMEEFPNQEQTSLEACYENKKEQATSAMPTMHPGPQGSIPYGTAPQPMNISAQKQTVIATPCRSELLGRDRMVSSMEKSWDHNTGLHITHMEHGIASAAPSPAYTVPANAQSTTPCLDARLDEDVKDSLAGFTGTLEVELLGARGFMLVADKRLPRPVWKAICDWPGAERESQGRWRFPVNKYSEVRSKLMGWRQATRVNIELPPAWVLAVFPMFQKHGRVVVPKKTANALRGDAPMQELAKESLCSRDGRPLLPYQCESIEFGLRRGGRMLLADEMGLGKTAQALMLMSQFQDDWPLLVVCPSALRATWRDEAKNWVPTNIISNVETEIQVVRKGSDNVSPEVKLLIVSYDLAAQNPRFCQAPSGTSFRMVICDESHYIKSPASRRAQAMLPLLHKARRCILLSGTPAMGKAAELHSPLDALLPGLLPCHQ